MRYRLLSATVVTVLLAACAPEQDDLRAYIDRINARPGQPLPPLPEVRRYEPFEYEAADRRPPFFPLDALRMVGTVTVGGKRFALVRDPDGIIHRVPIGAYAGHNFGRIVAIEDSAVRLVEIVPDGFGGWVERPATLPLAESSAGDRP